MTDIFNLRHGDLPLSEGSLLNLQVACQSGVTSKGSAGQFLVLMPDYCYDIENIGGLMIEKTG